MNGWRSFFPVLPLFIQFPFPRPQVPPWLGQGRWECSSGLALSAEAAPHCTELCLQNLRSQSSSLTSSRKPRSQVTGPRSPYPEIVELFTSPHPSTRQPSALHSQILASRSASCWHQCPEWGGAAAVPIFCCTLCRIGAHLAKWMMLRLFGWVNNLSSGAQRAQPNKAEHVLHNQRQAVPGEAAASL